MADLLELAERLERVVKPNNQLDREIAEAMGLVRRNALDQAVYGSGSGSLSPPRYTASLDAAMTLVPEDSGMSFAKSVSRGGGWSVALYDENVMARGETRALALCAAALRARASQQSTDGAQQ